MQNQEAKEIRKAIAPIVDLPILFSKQRLLLNEMFATAVANAPADEIDNFTAKRLRPFFLALSETLDNLEGIPQLAMDNQISLLDPMP